MAAYNKWVAASLDEPLAEVANRSLANRLGAVDEYLVNAATRPAENIEYVHQMRVWSRRAGAALQLYAALVPEWRAERLGRHLKRIRRSANDARDDDVFAQRLSQDQDDPGARLLLDKVRAHRQRAQEPIVAVYRKLDRGEKLTRRSAKLLQRVGTGRRAAAGRLAFEDWARQRMQLEVQLFFTAAESQLADPAALHALRIAGKKLRYSWELLAAAVADPLRSRVYAATKEVQDRLGEINDHATAEQRLRRWIEEADPRGAARAYLQARVNSEAQAAARLHDSFLEWWSGSREESLRAAFNEALGPLQLA